MVGWHHWLNGHEFEQTPQRQWREAWRAAVHGVTKIRTRLSDWTTTDPYSQMCSCSPSLTNLWLCFCRCGCVSPPPAASIPSHHPAASLPSPSVFYTHHSADLALPKGTNDANFQIQWLTLNLLPPYCTALLTVLPPSACPSISWSLSYC